MTASVLFTNVRIIDGTGAKEPEIRSAQTRGGRSVA